MMSELDHVMQQIAALQQEQQRLRQLSLEAQAFLTQLSKQPLQRASLESGEERERQYRDTQSQLLALLERRFELADELAKAQRRKGSLSSCRDERHSLTMTTNQHSPLCWLL